MDFSSDYECFPDSTVFFLLRNEANLTAIETDGPYPGYSCASSNHAYHQNGLDSTYHQTRLQSQFYIELHKMGMYINQPDDYFYFGANKAAMGYNEGQFSLPRWYYISIFSIESLFF